MLSMVEKHIDFHTHTNYSDGVTKVDDVVRAARFNGLDYIAITDHDNVRALKEAHKVGKRFGIGIINGVEISTDKYHILGLGIRPKTESFVEFLELSEKYQKQVCERRVNALAKQGVPITMEKVIEVFPQSRLGKMNLWYTLAQDGECQNFFREKGITLNYEGYLSYLVQAGDETSDKETEIEPKEAIGQIHLAGGLAFIAHPFKHVKNMKELDMLVKQGLDGLEIQPAHNGRNEPFREYAKQHNLLTTYGSDWHGGVFGRAMLTGKGENVLDKKLAKALGINLEETR